jgi:hypothetical protein
MSFHVRSCVALLAATTAVATGCAATTEGGDEGPATLAIEFEGATYTPQEFSELGVSPVRFVSTVESAREGVVHAFATPAARDAFVASLPERAPTSSFNRNNSKFYEDPSYGNKLLELGVGEAVLDLGTHPCNCNQMISSLKASQDARWTKLYDAVDLDPDFGEWWIASGAEISDMRGYFQPSGMGGESWVNDVSSIQVTN